MIKNYQILGAKVQVVPNYIVKETIKTFLNSDSQHQIVTVNPEFIVTSQEQPEFLKIINEASLATIDGNGIIKALQFLGQDISLDDRLTGVDLSRLILDIAERENHRVLFCLASHGLTKLEDFAVLIKSIYPTLEYQVADEISALDKAQSFLPEIILVGLGAPRQDIWLWQNMPKMPSVRIGVGVGGTFDFMSGRQTRAPKFLRSLGLEWFWRLLMQPHRFRRIYRAIIVFPYLVIKYKYQKKSL